MKNILKSIMVRTMALAALVFAMAGCKDVETALPLQYLSLSTHAILSPSFATTYTFDVEANCEWTLEITGENTDQWVSLSTDHATGLATVSITVTGNDGNASRSFEINAISGDRSASDQLTFVQAPATADGVIAISDVRALAKDGDYTFTQAMKLRGFVVSDTAQGSYYASHIAIEGEPKANGGIAIHTSAAASLGTEVEVDLQNAVIGLDPESGIVEVRPASSAALTATDTTPMVPAAVSISYDDLMSGAYESMYVVLNVQALDSDVEKTLGEGITVETPDGDTFAIEVSAGSPIADNGIPVQSGYLSGIVGKRDGQPTVMPLSMSDIRFTEARFNGGIKLPYIISMMTNSATNGDTKYATYNGDNATGHIDDVSFTPNDGTGAMITAKMSGSGSNLGFRHWHENSGHHNLPIKSWTGGKDNYILFTLPIRQTLDGTIRISFGFSGSGGGPANYEWWYSTDNENWKEAIYKFSIPTGFAVGSSKNFFYYQFDFTPDQPIAGGSTLYFRITTTNLVNVNGTGEAGDGGEPRFHSCFVLEEYPTFYTSQPADAIYFEPFDNLTEGLDYRHGDKLSAMINYCGSEISTWSNAAKRSLTGENVHQRPGYAQIGYVETQTVAHTALTNTVGKLETPKLGTSGTLKLTFDAMAYKNTAVYAASKDKDGDKTSVVVEVLGGGTIGGSTKATVNGLSYTEFSNFALTIDGATANTSLRFTSEPAEGEFSRWFIDNICVTK